ncbi:hypothetical protein ACO1MN_16735, partial [Staphylococcus aureus]
NQQESDPHTQIIFNPRIFWMPYYDKRLETEPEKLRDPTMATPFFYWKGELTEVVVTGNKGSKSKSLSGNADAITVR